jgi:hypothetical protein
MIRIMGGWPNVIRYGPRHTFVQLKTQFRALQLHCLALFDVLFMSLRPPPMRFLDLLCMLGLATCVSSLVIPTLWGHQ